MPVSLEDEIRKLRDRFWSERDPDGHVFAPLADAQRRAGRLDEATELVEDGLSRLPEFVPGHLVCARILRDGGDAEGASAAYRRALELDPENVIALREAAGVAEELDRTGRALELWHRLVRLEPEDPDLREHVRELKRRHFGVEAPAERKAVDSEGEEAADEGEEADRDDGTEVYTRTMGDLYARQGLVERAAAIYRQLVERHPDDRELRSRLAELESAAAEDEPPASEEDLPEASAEEADVETLARELAEGPDAADDLDTPFAWSGGEEPDSDAGDGRSIASYFRPMLEWPSGGEEEGGS